MAGLPIHFLTVYAMSSSKMAGWLARGTPLAVNNTVLMQLRIGYNQTVYVPQDTRAGVSTKGRYFEYCQGRQAVGLVAD